MIKVPGTDAGVPAIRTLISEGLNINVTLLFSGDAYEQVAEAYIGGLQDRAAQGGDISHIASVASFFVSRIDVSVEHEIDRKLTTLNAREERERLKGVLGKVAIANAKLAYRRYQRLFSGPRWEALSAKGAMVQRLLWASTGRKNKAYSDVLYVEQLIAPDTVNTMPPETMEAFRDHGSPHQSLTQGLDEAESVMATLAASGISIDTITSDLVTEGVKAFADSFDKLLGAVATKRCELLGNRVNSLYATLPGDLEAKVDAALEDWRKSGKMRKLWAGDASLWTGKDEADWLGWLDIVTSEIADKPRLAPIADDIRGEDFAHVVLIGMGGSSLGAEVLGRVFRQQDDRPKLIVLDSTDPAQIRTVEGQIDLTRTVFIVSSKSGTTMEPNVLKDYFFARVSEAVGDHPGSRFIAITDPGTPLVEVAKRDGFRHIAYGKPSIGGRYSVLSDFGLVPAACVDLDIDAILRSAEIMARSCSGSVPPLENPGVKLGAILGVLGNAGRNKVTLVASPRIASFGAWAEQLLAESTGKDGKALIPVDDEPLGFPEVYGPDRVFVYLRLETDADALQDQAMLAYEQAGHPVVRIAITDPTAIAQEFVRFEFATAVAGSIMGLNPFNQPDVEASKTKTRELMQKVATSGSLPAETALVEANGLKLFTSGSNGNRWAAAGGDKLRKWLEAHFLEARDGDYYAILAYIERNDRNHDDLEAIRVMIRDKKRIATCLGFGPRFLHSTGQAYKGGPNTGLFLQITADDATDIRIPEKPYTFGQVKAAEALGDFEVLADRGRRLVRIHISGDLANGLLMLKEVIASAMNQE